MKHVVISNPSHCRGRASEKRALRSPQNTRVLAVSSGGGHWVQLKRILPAFEDCQLVVATVPRGARDTVSCSRQLDIPDATRWDKRGLLRLAWRLFWIVARERPEVVVSTGAAPGFFALRFGKWVGAQTIWIDSIANFESMSLSGERVRRHADLWLTQWAHLARPEGPAFLGAVL